MRVLTNAEQQSFTKTFISLYEAHEAHEANQTFINIL